MLRKAGNDARDGRPLKRHLDRYLLQEGAVAPDAEDGGERGAHLDSAEELRPDAQVVRDEVEEGVAARGRRLPEEDEERGQPDLPLRHRLPQQAALRARIPDKLLQRAATAAAALAARV